MKVLKSTVLYEKKSADIISKEIKNKLRHLHLLGDDSPQVLLYTFFYTGLYFAPRGGEEYRRL